MIKMAVITAWPSYNHRPTTASTIKNNTGKDTKSNKKIGTGHDTKMTKTIGTGNETKITKKIGTQCCRKTRSACKTTSAGSETKDASEKNGHGQICKATITAVGYEIKAINDRNRCRGGNLGQIGKKTKVGNNTKVGKKTTIGNKTPEMAGGPTTSRRAQRLERLASGTRSVRSSRLARQTIRRRRRPNDGAQTSRAITRPD